MQRKSIWIRIALIGMGALALVALYLFWPISADVVHLADAGADYEVEILRDSWGVPHIFGKTDADAAFGLAYAHAEDDFRARPKCGFQRYGDGNRILEFNILLPEERSCSGGHPARAKKLLGAGPRARGGCAAPAASAGSPVLSLTSIFG